MAYSIRYGKLMHHNTRITQLLLRQIAVSCVLLAGIGLMRLLGLPAEGAARILTPRTLNITEQAVCAASQTLAAGEGWYEAAVVWCRTVLRLTPG